MSRILSFDYETVLEFSSNVTEHAFLLRCMPPELPQQHIIASQLIISPETSFTVQKDSFGNLMQYGRIDMPHNYLSYRSIGSAELDLSRRQPEVPMPIMRFPSAYTFMSHEMEEFYRELPLPAGSRERTELIMRAVAARLRYTPGTTDTSTTAEAAFHSGHGVCQDYAHVFIALARRSGLYARYVNGLHEGVGASHAWCEVWLDGVWTGIDPTEGVWTDESYIRFSVGRDFSDCPMERGVFNGMTVQKQTIRMECIRQE